MSITYRFTIDESYLQQRYERVIDQRKWYSLLSTQTALFLVSGVVGGLMMLSLEGGSKYLPAIIAGIALGLLGNFLREKMYVKGPTLLQRALLRQKRKEPDFEITTSVTLSDTGVVEIGPATEISSDWKSFAAAVRFSDGILLPRFLYLLWLPDSALVDASPDHVTRFVEERMRPRAVRQMK